MFYLLSSNGSGRTYTANISGVTPNSFMLGCSDFNSSLSSVKWHYDSSNQAQTSGSTNPVSGVITSQSNSELVAYAAASYVFSATWSSPLINGATPTGTSWTAITGCCNDQAHGWYSILSAPAFNFQGTATLSLSRANTAEIAAWYLQ